VFVEMKPKARKNPSRFLSLSDSLMPIPELRDSVLTESQTGIVFPPSTMSRERVVMSMNAVTEEAHEVMGTLVGQLQEATEQTPKHITSQLHQAHPEDAALEEIERFRAFALDTVERSMGGLLAAFAQEVLGRELALAPVDLNEIAQRALRRYEREGPVRIRVAPADVGNVKTELPIVVDADLREGDLIVEVRDGMLDARMNVRYDCMMRRFINSIAEHSP
jgi:flagellar biosynthesis/type III secretory pathway protein FliH